MMKRLSLFFAAFGLLTSLSAGPSFARESRAIAQDDKMVEKDKGQDDKMKDDKMSDKKNKKKKKDKMKDDKNKNEKMKDDKMKDKSDS